LQPEDFFICEDKR
jgi:glycosyltransferase involved in cell wall biosynthesis